MDQNQAKLEKIPKQAMYAIKDYMIEWMNS